MSDWCQHKPYAAYLFDLDGTLIDTAPDIMEALNHALATDNLGPVSEELTRHWIGHGGRAMIKQALLAAERNADDAAVDDLLEPFMDFYHEHCAERSAPYPAVLATLDALKGMGAALAVVTNKATRFTGAVLEGLNMSHYFDAVVCGDTTDHPKPHRAPVDHCLAQLDATADRALFVGDSETDVGAAKAAGVRVVCMRDGYNHGIDVATLKPDGVIDTFAELL